MRQWIRSHLTYANVMVTILAFLVLGGGTALASFVVSSNSQIGPGTVSGHNPPAGKHANLVPGSVSSFDLADRAVNHQKLGQDAVTGANVLNNSLTGADINESTLGTVPSASHANNANQATNAGNLGGIPASGFQRSLRWAVVRANSGGASVVRGNATGASRLGTGQYIVSFQPDIRDCAYVATNGDTAAGIGQPGEISVEQQASNNSTDVEVRHYDPAGNQVDYSGSSGFHIIVICPPA